MRDKLASLAVGLVSLLLCGIAATDGYLTHSAILDPYGMYKLLWGFNGETITFEVQVRTRGYIGLGFSRNGGMKGADIIIGWVDSGGKVHVQDYHGIGNMEPVIDQSQDVEVLYGDQNATHTTLQFIRALDTCDHQDNAIGQETIRLIWSFNDEDPDGISPKEYHGHFRGSKSIFLLNPTAPKVPMPPGTINIELRNHDVSVPDADTFYWCQSFELPKLDTKHHIIQIEPIINAIHVSLVHHIIVYGCYHPVHNISINTGHECYSRNMPYDWWDCNAVLFAWAIGGTGVAFPRHVGIPIGTDDDPTLLVMETHYDNPTLLTDIKDASGIMVTVTPETRLYDAGVLQLGSLVSRRQVIPPYEQRFTTAGHCVPECTRKAMKNHTEGIKLIGVTFHSHLMGRAMRLRHFRDGMELPMIAEDRHYDFNLQQQHYLKEEVTILPGDSMIVECDYDSRKKTEVTLGGLSTESEMCLAFPVYYPRLDFSECATAPSDKYLEKFVDMTKYASHHWTLLFEKLDWTNETLRQEFQKYITAEGVVGYEINCRKGLKVFMDPAVEISIPKTLSVLDPLIDQKCLPQGAVGAVSSASRRVFPTTTFLVIMLLLSFVQSPALL